MRERLLQTLAIWRVDAMVPQFGGLAVVSAPLLLLGGPLLGVLMCVAPSVLDGVWGALLMMLSGVGFIGLCMSGGTFVSEWDEASRVLDKALNSSAELWDVAVNAEGEGAAVVVCSPCRPEGWGPRRPYIRHKTMVPQGEDFAGRLLLARRDAKRICQGANALGAAIQTRKREASEAMMANQQEVANALTAIHEVEAW